MVIGALMKRRPNQLFKSFSWHSSNPALVEAADLIIERLKDKAGVRKAVDWSTKQKLSDGLHLVWKDPQNYNAGYAWWVRQIGSLVPDRRGQSSLWNVTGHKTSERRQD